MKKDVIQHAELLPRRVKHHGKPEHIVQIHLVLIKFGQRGFGNEKRLPAQEFGGRAIGGLDKPDQWRPLVHTDGVDLHLSGRFVPSLKIHHIPAQELQRVGIVIDADFATDAVGTGERAYFDQIGRDVALFRHELLHDFQHDATMGLGRGRAEQRTERTGGPALLADHLAQIFLGDAQLKDGALFPFHLDDLHVFRLVHKPFGDKFHKIFHSVPVLFGEGKQLSAAEAFGKTGVLHAYRRNF